MFNKTHIFAVRLNILNVFGIKTKVNTFKSKYLKNQKESVENEKKRYICANESGQQQNLNRL